MLLYRRSSQLGLKTAITIFDFGVPGATAATAPKGGFAVTSFEVGAREALRR